MDELLTGWAKVIADERFPDALDGGESAVIHLMGEVLDQWLQTLLPEYAMAVALCAEIDIGKFDCDLEREKLRDKMLREVLIISGVIILLRKALAAWRKLPAETRRRLKLTLASAKTVAELLQDPSASKLYAAVVANANQAREFVGPVLNDVWSGRINSPTVNGFMNLVATVDPTGFKQRMMYYGFDIEGVASNALEELAAKVFGKDLAKIMNLLVNPVARVRMAISLGLDAAQAGLDAAGNVLGGAVTATGDAFEAIGGVATDAADAAKKAGEAAVNVITGGARVVGGALEDIGDTVSKGVSAINPFD